MNLPDTITDDLAYICGVLAGDGSIWIRQSKYEYAIKCVGNPKDEKEFYHQIIHPLFLKVFNLNINVKFHDSKTTYGFTIYSKALVTFFTKIIGLPCGKKYSSLKIPSLFKNNEDLLKSFIRGVADTDFCISFKKKYKSTGYYPVISGSSKSKLFIQEINEVLRKKGFKTVLSLDYKRKDSRLKKGYSIINIIELNGKNNLNKWMEDVGFRSPKHLSKIRATFINA